MKPIYFFILALLCTQIGWSQKKKGSRVYITKAADNGVFLLPQNKAVNPGDTVVLKASDAPYSYFFMGGYQGTKEAPIVIINEGGQVLLTAGFDFQSCQYIKLTGSGTKDKYGFLIRQGGTALGIKEKSAHMEAERFYVDKATFGCWVKNEANCDTSINSWVLNDISIHDFELHNIGIEGFYMGSTDPNNKTRPISCNGEQKFYRPSTLGNIKVYNGIIDGTGRPAILLANAPVGLSEIYNNTIRNVGREGNDQQGSGISIGSYTRAYVHHNNIKNTLTWGIVSLGGAGLLRIEDNRVDSSGYLDGRSLNWPQNIVVDTRLTIPVDSTRFIIRNNIVSNPGRDVANIEVWRTIDSYKEGNIICNNTSNGKAAVVRTDPAVRWNACNGAQASAATSNKKSWLIYLFVAGGGFTLLMLFIYAKRKQRQFAMA